MTKTYISKGDLTQQFAAFKQWLESDRKDIRMVRISYDRKEKEVIKERKAFRFG